MRQSDFFSCLSFEKKEERITKSLSPSHFFIVLTFFLVISGASVTRVVELLQSIIITCPCHKPPLWHNLSLLAYIVIIIIICHPCLAKAAAVVVTPVAQAGLGSLDNTARA